MKSFEVEKKERKSEFRSEEVDVETASALGSGNGHKHVTS